MARQLDRGAYARFMRNVTIVQRTHDTPCWEWTGPQISDSGYGKTRPYPGDKERPTHIVMWEHRNGRAVPEGMQLDHLCRNRICCNDNHLEVVTRSENILRQDHAERRVTSCPQGHLYDEANTIVRRGRRFCRACDVERKRRSREG